MIEAILGLPEPVITGLLLAAFILTLVIAFKIMEMVTKTLTVAVLSGVFYLGLIYITATEFALNDLLLFSVLGASLYMFFTLLASVISTTETLLKVPLALLKAFYRVLKKIYGLIKSGLKKIWRTLKLKIRDHREEEIDPKDKSTKEVVLNSD